MVFTKPLFRTFSSAMVTSRSQVFSPAATVKERTVPAGMVTSCQEVVIQAVRTRSSPRVAPSRVRFSSLTVDSPFPGWKSGASVARVILFTVVVPSGRVNFSLSTPPCRKVPPWAAAQSAPNVKASKASTSERMAKYFRWALESLPF